MSYFLGTSSLGPESETITNTIMEEIRAKSCGADCTQRCWGKARSVGQKRSGASVGKERARPRRGEGLRQDG